MYTSKRRKFSVIRVKMQCISVQLKLIAMILVWRLCSSFCPPKARISPCQCTGHESSLFCKSITVTDMGSLLQPIAQWTGTKLKSFDFTGDVDHKGALTILSRNDFVNITFEVITIRFTNLRNIDPDAFASNTQTTWKLILPQNHLVEQVFVVTSKFKKLQVLILNNNQIRKIPIDAFQADQSQLHKIDLSHNHITAIGNEVFALLPNLEHININHNKISVIGSNAFMSTRTSVSDRRLVIDMERNELRSRSFRKDSLRGRREVKLNMAENYIEILSESVFRPIFESGGSIDMRMNPLSCSDCSFPAYLRTFTPDKCRNCNCHNGTSVHSLNPEALKCPVSASVVGPCVGRGTVDKVVPPLPRSEIETLHP